MVKSKGLVRKTSFFWQKKKHKGPKKETKPHKDKKGHSIDDRPREIDERNTFGLFEGDTIVSTVDDNYAFVSLIERLTRKQFTVKVSRNTKRCFQGALRKIIKMCPVIKSITFDNGSEFSGVEQILEILRKHTPDANIYYAHPYRSCERGSNERNHVFIRRMAPKWTKLCRMSPKRLQRTTDFTNAYPR